jgi:hypothetical protein
MKQRICFVCLILFSMALACWNAITLVQQFQRCDFHSLVDRNVTSHEVAVIVLLVTLSLTFVVINESHHAMRGKSIRTGFVATRVAWLLGLLASNVNISTYSSSSVSSVTSPITSSLSPIAAVSVLVHIERRRRNQIREHRFPDVLTEIESEMLREIRLTAAKSSTGAIGVIGDDVVQPWSSLLMAVDRAAPIEPAVGISKVPDRWVVEVKVYGYPMVVSVDGVAAEFRKKRALELLTWLSLNRDRSRRSAARTAMWDIDITDSAFATVVSDMRRALRELNTQSEEISWAPPTYSDDIPLSPLVVTDADRLQVAYQQFKSSNGSEIANLVEVLKGIRDVPFAGTNYAWADLDGTTTRLVISAVEICMDVAQIAGERNETDLLLAAVSAGLRVLPGCEDLLNIQRDYAEKKFDVRVHG